MQNISRLTIPMFFGGMAAVANWLYVGSQFDKIEFVVAKQDIQPDMKLAEYHLDKIEVPRALVNHWPNNFISWEDRHHLIHQSTNQPFSRGELVFIDSIVANRVSQRPGYLATPIRIATDQAKSTPIVANRNLLFLVENQQTRGTQTLGPARVLSVEYGEEALTATLELPTENDGNLSETNTLLAKIGSEFGPRVISVISEAGGQN